MQPGSPQNLLARSSLDPVQCLALGGDPLASGILHFQRHIQLTGLNFVDVGACGVGELCEGSAYQHGQAQNHGHDAAQQGPFGTLAVCHSIFPLIFLHVRVLAVGLLRKLPQREYGSPQPV